MTDPTETLLRDTFASREHLADPDRAIEIAGALERHPRRWPTYAVAVAAVVGIAVLSTLLVGGSHGDREGPSSPPTTTGAAPTTYQGNRAIALAEAQRVVRLVPLPDGAQEASLDDWPDSAFGMAPSDPDLRQIAVWSVPTDADTVEKYLRDHDLEGTSASNRASGSSHGGPIIPSYEYVVPSPDPEAMIDTTVMVQWLQDGDRTLVRADTFTAARTVRSDESLVPTDVTAVGVTDNDHPGQGPRGAVPGLSITAVEDRDTVAALRDAVNRLAGSIRPVQVVSCPARLGPVPTVTLTFSSPTEELRFHLVDWCLGQVSIRHDGVRLPGALDPGDLTQIVERLLP